MPLMPLPVRAFGGAVAVALAAASVTGCAASEPGIERRPVASPSASLGTSLVPVNPATVAPSAADQAAATSTALQWTQRWLRPAGGVQSGQWVAGLEPLTSPELVTQLRTVDPRNVDSTRITGPAVIRSVMAEAITVDVPTDAMTVRVLVVHTEGRWLVHAWDPAS